MDKDILLLRNPIIAHPHPSLTQLPQHILPSEVSGAQNARAQSDGIPIPPEPVPRRRYHRCVVRAAVVFVVVYEPWRRGIEVMMLSDER